MRLHWRVRHVGVEVGLFENPVGCPLAGRQVAAFVDQVAVGRHAQQVVVDAAVIDPGLRLCVLGIHAGDREVGLVTLLVQYSHQVAVANDLCAGHRFGAGGIQVCQLRPVGRRPQYPRVHHAGQADVRCELRLARDLFQGIAPLERGPHGLVFLRCLERHLPADAPGDGLALGQHDVGNPAAGICTVKNHAVPGFQPLQR